MNKTLILILTLLPLISFGQHLKYCESAKQVESYLSGQWRENNAESKTVYKYWFTKGKGHLSESEISENGEELIELEVQPFVEIIKYDGGFKIKFIYQYETWISELKYLNSSKLVLKRNGVETEFYKLYK
ncbi:hypothetical protein [Seonamhaeicola marinus]|uniref:DUF5640 domain-containing protein n=1 Tax=Seonamhaeicola marinus TaxID=1912246 RepID=A0A5D0I429_9FLAO|nr:hypothetical protein [Seonamhaeicola marinus]TYA78394.1 hypothetical protein FUA24_08535 [Seonamhaeicola marinus]